MTHDLRERLILQIRNYPDFEKAQTTGELATAAADVVMIELQSLLAAQLQAAAASIEKIPSHGAGERQERR